eukprot:CAMPEP_0183740782 /NCGR_PEP_ID=MMETSP0737-20130205/60502_1 /TAXON_ID=385413 /ORGANISM="Thalassiosira miniscula, Strain CCMP1093" /LENGTH=228 /DNA_ID=CAMNT_0025975927 /DNA_START=69 /DNA_END=755 /DNA_ORIENTATION=+
MKATSTASVFFLICAFAAIIIQKSQATHAGTKSLVLGHQRTTAFCSFNNSATRKNSISTWSLKAAENSESETDKMGTWNPFSLAVLKLGFTEPAWTSPLNYKKADGTYSCANCNTPLFPSAGKYDSGSGWPSFWKTIASDRVSLEREWDGRIECKCANCGGHLGHVFPDGPTRGSLDMEELNTVPESDPQIGYKVQGKDTDGKDSKYSRMPRFCVNGAALRFEEDSQL